MAASMTVDAQHNPFMDGVSPLRLVIDWISHTDGVVSLPIAATFAAAQALKFATPPAPTKVRGVFRSCETIPGLNGDKVTATPTNLYDLTILDAYGYDILMAGGVDRSATVADKVVASVSKLVVDSELTITIANAGSGLKGRIILEFDSMDTVSAS